MNLDFTNQELYDNGINLDVVIVKPGYEDIDKVKKLFDVSFEGEERPKITNLLRDDDKLEFYAFYNDGNFIGASVWVNIMKKIMYGLWLAVNPEFRGHGYGTQIVKFAKLLARKRGKVYMGTIQDPNEKSDNQEYRKFRWNFYKKLGFHLTNYGYTDGKENLKMITLNGRVGKNISNKAVEEAFKYYNNTLNETFNNEIQAQEDNLNDAIDDLSYIQFKDPEVERICHEKLHVYTYADAKKITNIPQLCFYSSKIESFDELKYFTNLKEIGTNAFLGCNKLKSIILPDSITTIKGGVFCCCESLEYIKLPKNLQNIAPDLFSHSNIKQIIIPNKVTTIGDMAFQCCKYLQQIIIPNSVDGIGDRAFFRCESLQQITIPDNIRYIGNEAFFRCESLQQITIPNSVDGIGDRAFFRCESLQQITIPDNIRYIGNEAFDRCKNLEAIYVSKENYEKFKDRGFGTLLKIKNDSNLINETFNNEIQAKEDNLNDAIDDLSYIQFEDPIVEKICHEQLHVYTYEDAKKIIELNARSGFYNSEIKSFDELKYFINLKKIGNYAFSGCKSLQQINIPNGVTEIGSCAFMACNSLQQINIPNGVTEIDNYAFSGCNSLQQINIPNGVTEIGSCAFFNCESLQQINIPNGITKISSDAFFNCESLQQINIPNGVTEIGSCAFCNCNSLQQINIPNSVTEIGSCAFCNCNSLEAIYVSKENYEEFKDREFGTLLKIKNDSNLINETFNNEIQAKEDNLNDAIDDLAYIQFEDPLVEQICHEKLHVYTYEDAKKIIELNARSGFYSSEIKSFNELKYFINLKKIEKYTFNYCKSLQQINIPNGVTEISSGAFCDCESLQQINIPNGVTKIGYYAFAGCKSLQQINIPNSVTEIDDYAFIECKSLQQINIPDSVTEIGSCAFMACNSLQQINIPNVTEIGPCAFCNCKSLQIIDISGITSITKLKSSAFEKCSNLKTIYVSPILYKKIYKYKNSKEYLNIFDKFKIKELHETFNNEIQAKENNIDDAIDDLAYIQFEDPEVERICHEKLHVYTYEDAKKVTNLCNFGRNIKYFNELKYFTNLKKINDHAFATCSQLKQITLPDSITEIGNTAFFNCKSLQHINIPNKVTKIGYAAFYQCESLQEITLPESLQNIQDNAFCICSSLSKIIIPENTNYIGAYAFQYCKKLSQIDIPSKVKDISGGAFSNCTSLKLVNLPNTITKIRMYAFAYCKNLQQIIIPDSVNTLSDKAFYSCRNLRSIYVSKYLYNVLQSGKFIGKSKLKIKKDKPKKLINETFNNEIQSEKDNTFSEKIINTLNIDNDLNFAIKARVKKWWNEKKNDINFKNKLEEEHREIIKEPYDSFYYECNKKDCPYFDFISLGISEQYQKDINKDYESYADDFNFIIVPLDRNTICISVYSSIYNEISENDSLLNDSESGWTYTLTDVISDSIRNEQYDKELKDIFKTNLIQNTYKQLSYYEYRRNISDIIKILDKAFNTWVKERFA